ncbi:MAG TPA: sigma-70 family RNA polymerase sigma factor [Planctomycetota bacterium]|nr:sigma-70 family RNA polymerase sigma factor [Planctomycetota bacterium]
MPAVVAGLRAPAHGGRTAAKEESCDIVQSVAREVLNHADRFQHGGEAGFREWLFTTAHRKVIKHLDHWRAEKRSGAREATLPEALAGLTATPSRHASAREQMDAVERAFDALSTEQRDVITWSRLLGLSHAEIAARLGKTEVAVRKILSRGLARLTAVLAEADGGRAP